MCFVCGTTFLKSSYKRNLGNATKILQYRIFRDIPKELSYIVATTVSTSILTLTIYTVDLVQSVCGHAVGINR